MPIIVPYQETWPAEFEAIAARLRAGLGALALRVDHIGSTAVPGLAAKDIIDVQVTVAGLEAADVAAVSGAMEAMGYRPPDPTLDWLRGTDGLWRDHRPPGAAGPDEDWVKLYFDQPTGQRPTHAHVRALGRPNQRYPLLFRDYLRGHPATAAAYAELKRRLAAGLADPDTYPDVKDPAVDLIYFAAEEWAGQTGWRAR